MCTNQIGCGNTNNPSTTGSDPKLKQNRIGFREILNICLGGTIGGPIFVILGTLIALSGVGVLISFVLIGSLIICYILLYSELAIALPSTGGNYTFSKEAIGGLAGFLLGWLLLIGNLIFIALSCIGFVYSLNIFIPANLIDKTELIAIGISVNCVLFILNWYYNNLLQRIIKLFTKILIYGFIGYIVIGIGGAIFLIASTDSIPALDYHFELSPLLQTMALSFVIFCPYEWNSTFDGLIAKFDLIKSPRKILPKAFIISSLIGVLIYFLVAFTTLLLAGSPQTTNWILITQSTIPLSTALGIVFGDFGIYIIGLAGIIATITSAQAGISMSLQMFTALAQDHQLPDIFLKTRKSRPINTLITIFCTSSVILAISDIYLINQLTNFIFLLSMIILAISVIILRKSRPNLDRPWKVPFYPILPLLSIIIGIILLISLSIDGIGIGFAVLIIGLIYYFMRMARQNRIHLIFCGANFTGAIFCLIISFLIINSPILKLMIIIGSGTILLITIYDLIPIERIILRFDTDQSETTIIGGFSILSEATRKKINRITTGNSIIGIIFGIFLVILSNFYTNFLVKEINSINITLEFWTLMLKWILSIIGVMFLGGNLFTFNRVKKASL